MEGDIFENVDMNRDVLKTLVWKYFRKTFGRMKMFLKTFYVNKDISGNVFVDKDMFENVCADEDVFEKHFCGLRYFRE